MGRRVSGGFQGQSWLQTSLFTGGAGGRVGDKHGIKTAVRGQEGQTEGAIAGVGGLENVSVCSLGLLSILVGAGTDKQRPGWGPLCTF